MYIGQDHTQVGISHPAIQIACHRVSNKIDTGLSDEDLKDKLLTVYQDDEMYSGSVMPLKKFLDQCKQHNVIPIINNNTTYRDRFLDAEEFGRRSKLFADILDDYKFGRAYISDINEPAKRHKRERYRDLVNASHGGIGGRYPHIAGNEEWWLALYPAYGLGDYYNYILDHAEFDVLGVHPLSCMDIRRKYRSSAIGKPWHLRAVSR